MASVTEWTGAPPYRYIDVSRWQGKIKMEGWAQVKAAGYKGVMLRAVGSRNGVPYIDPTFEGNYSNAKAAGLDVGACTMLGTPMWSAASVAAPKNT